MQVFWDVFFNNGVKGWERLERLEG